MNHGETEQGDNLQKRNSASLESKKKLRVRKKVRKSTLAALKASAANRSQSQPNLIEISKFDDVENPMKQDIQKSFSSPMVAPVQSMFTQSSTSGTKGTRKRVRKRVKKDVKDQKAAQENVEGPKEVSAEEVEKGKTGDENQVHPHAMRRKHFNTGPFMRKNTKESIRTQIGPESRERLLENRNKNRKESGISQTISESSEDDSMKTAKSFHIKDKNSDIEEEHITQFTQIEPEDSANFSGGAPRKSFFDYLKRKKSDSQSSTSHKDTPRAFGLTKAALVIESIILVLSALLHFPYLATHGQGLGLHMGIWTFCRGNTEVPFQCYNWSEGTEPQMPIYVSKLPKIQITRGLLVGHHLIVVLLFTCLIINFKTLQPILCVAWMATTSAISQTIIMMSILWLICALFDFDMFWLGWAMYCGIIGFVLHYVQVFLTYQISNMDYWGFEVDYRSARGMADADEPKQKSQNFHKTKLLSSRSTRKKDQTSL